MVRVSLFTVFPERGVVALFSVLGALSVPLAMNSHYRSIRGRITGVQRE